MSNKNNNPAEEQLDSYLPPGINTAAVKERMNGMILAGTDALIARKMAIDAERQQMDRDAMNQVKTAQKRGDK